MTEPEEFASLFSGVPADVAARVRFHECGHCIVNLALGIRVIAVTADGKQGLTRRRFASDSRNVVSMIACEMGGYFSERKYSYANRKYALHGARTDIERAKAWAEQCSRYPNPRRCLRLAWGILARHWQCVVELTEALEKSGALDEDAILAIARPHGVWASA